MQVERLDSRAFHEQARAFLLEREAEHSVILGLASRLEVDPRSYGEDPYLAVAADGGRVVAAAVRTPPHGLLLAATDDDVALEALTSDVREVYRSLPGVVGPLATVQRFVELWQACTGAKARVAVAERAFQASSVRHPADVPGRSRPYREDDWGLVLSWLTAFEAEALPFPMPIDASESLRKRLADPESGHVLWEDDGLAVSLAGYTGPTPNGIRVGPVYTPPELRGRGYASALVADVTETLLAGGRSYCFLFTDLANPTSNSIYQRVGYEPVADVTWWVFE